MRAIRRKRVDPFVGKRIGRYIQSTRLETDVNFLSARPPTATATDWSSMPTVKAESALFKRLAFDVVFLSPQLKQLEHKGSRMLRQLWDVLGERYITGGTIDGQDFQLLPADTAAEITAAPGRSQPRAPGLRFPRRHDRRLRGAHLQALVLAGLRLDRRFDRLAGSLQHADIRQVAVFPLIVEAVTDHKFIADLEAHVVGRHRHGAGPVLG